MQLVAIRQCIGGALYVAYFIFRKTPWPKTNQWKTILILSLLNFVLSNGLSTWGVKYISSGLGAILGAIFPIWIVIITFFYFLTVRILLIMPKLYLKIEID